MSKKKNIQASNQNVINSQDGTMNSMNVLKQNISVSKTPSDFQQKQNSGIGPGMRDTKNK